MSISFPLAATTQPSASPDLVMAVWVLVAVGVAAWLHVFTPRTASGPIRIDRARPVWPLVLVLGMGLFVWFGGQVVILAVKQASLAGTQRPDARFDPSTLTATDYALLATLPGAAAFFVLLVGDLLYHGSAPGWLGISPRHVPRGLLAGLLGISLTLPLIHWVLQATDRVYRVFRYEHPSEHDLLRSMTDAPSPLVKWSLVAGAVLVAPFFEEYLFRGHVQTLLRQWFVRATRPLLGVSRVMGFEPVLSSPSDALIVPATPPPLPWPEAPIEPERPTVWQTWLAILVTSFLFTVVHSAWMFPAIFVLSVCLGYAYERTGNLWVNITMHALFNGASTALYLLR